LEWRYQSDDLAESPQNPAYAGAYAYGRRQIDPRKQQPGRPSTGRVVSDAADWHALIPDCFPAYISWGNINRIWRDCKQIKPMQILVQHVMVQPCCQVFSYAAIAAVV